MSSELRLERIERRQRMLTFGFAAYVAVSVAAVLAGTVGHDDPTIQESIRAKRIVVVDEDGEDAIILDTVKNRPTILLVRENQPLITLFGGESGMIAAHNAEGQPIVQLGAGALQLRSPSGEVLAHLSADSASGRLVLAAGKDRAQVIMQSGEDGGSIQLHNGADKLAVALAAEEVGGRFIILNARQEGAVSVQVIDGEGSVYVGDGARGAALRPDGVMEIK